MGSELVIVVVRIPARQVVRFQGMLDGEDGLAILRCRDTTRDTQQLWTTRSMLDALYAWVGSLPEALQVEVLWEEG